MSNTLQRICFDEDAAYQIHITEGQTASGLPDTQMHYDPEPIIEFFKQGRGIINIEGRGYPFQEGDVIIITPTELHTCIFQEDQPVNRISIHVNKKLLESFDCDPEEFFGFAEHREKGIGNVISAEKVQEFGIDSIIEKMAMYAANSESKYRVLARCKAIELLYVIARALPSAADDIIEPDIESDLISKIIQYINLHYRSPITLTSISEHFYHSKYHICTMFKKYMGITLTEYINIRRIHHANDLIRGGHSIHEACFAAGFHNYSNFYRVFTKHMGMTPQQFKGKQKL